MAIKKYQLAIGMDRTVPVEPLVPETMSISSDFRLSPSREAVLDRFARNFAEPVREKAERLEAMNVEVVLSPRQALRGGEVVVGVPAFTRCSACGGSSRATQAHCVTCAGTGLVEVEREVHVRIPPGAADRSVVEVELTDLGIRNFFLRAIVRIDTATDAQ
jgi:hypothetical protein